MGKLVIVTFVVCLLVILSHAAPPGEYRNAVPSSDSVVIAGRKAAPEQKGPVKIVYYKQRQIPGESEFHYVGSDGNSRRETIKLQAVKSGDKEVLVPYAVGDYNYTHDGTNIYSSYSSGVEGNSYSIIWNGQEKK